MQEVRFGVIGCGMIANFHAAALAAIPEARLVGCYDAYAPGAQAFAQARGITAFDTLEALLASPEIDAVSICTPSGLHTPQAIAAMRAGKHIVCEKPMSLTLADADALIATARETGVKTCIISQFRFTPAVQQVRRALEAGALGRVVSGSLQMKYFRTEAYYAQAGWRGTWAMDGGGALMNQGIHGVDVFRYLMGPVRELTGYTRTLTRPIEVEDSAVAIVEFASGAVGTLEGSTTCYPGYPRRIEICGDQGSVVLEEDAILRWDCPLPSELPVGAAARNVASADPKAINVDGHIRQLANFTAAIAHGEALLADAATGRPPLEIILGIYQSSQTGKPVRFEA